MKVVRAFVKDMKAYFAEPNAIKRDEIAGRQLQALRQYSPRYVSANQMPRRLPQALGSKIRKSETSR